MFIDKNLKLETPESSLCKKNIPVKSKWDFINLKSSSGMTKL
jgi:hypothetical protein